MTEVEALPPDIYSGKITTVPLLVDKSAFNIRFELNRNQINNDPTNHLLMRLELSLDGGKTFPDRNDPEYTEKHLPFPIEADVVGDDAFDKLGIPISKSTLGPRFDFIDEVDRHIRVIIRVLSKPIITKASWVIEDGNSP